MVRLIALVNQKGGVGKTTSTLNIGVGLHKAGKKVLLIDLDQQGNLTVCAGIKSSQLKNTIFEVLKGEITANEAIIHQGYDIIPADIRLSGAEMALNGAVGREVILKKALAPIVNNYDYILIDFPPNLGLVPLNGLVAVNEIFIPLQAEFLALNGISQLLNTVKAVQKKLNPNIKISGIFATLYDNRKNLNKEVLKKIRHYFPNQVFKAVIRNNVALAESPSYGKNIYDYKPDSKGAKDYKELNLVNEMELNGDFKSSTKEKLPEEWVRATFIIRKDRLKKLKDYAYTDRRTLKDVVNEMVYSYLADKKTIEKSKK